MNFLLVNDDGYGADGIVLVEKILSEYGDVYVCAPMEHQSGKACSLEFKPLFKYDKIDNRHYRVEGTPSQSTCFGLNALGVKFDCVVSGCNYGYNLSGDTMYSGTVGACVQSLFQRVPAIALSAEESFDIVEEELRNVLDYILDNKLLSSDYILNVNFPQTKKAKGIKITSLHPCLIDYKYYLNDDGTFIYRRFNAHANAKRGSDVYAVEHGYISITPLNMFLDSQEGRKALKK